MNFMNMMAAPDSNNQQVSVQSPWMMMQPDMDEQKRQAMLKAGQQQTDQAQPTPPTQNLGGGY